MKTERHAHQHEHVKRDVVTLTETYVAEATAQPNVVVIVDNKGKAIKTATEAFTAVNVYKLAAATPTPAAVVAAVVAPVVEAVKAVPTVVAAVASLLGAPAPAGASGFGLAYSPFNKDGSCKNYDQIMTDFAMLGEYGLIRTYGVECNTIDNVYAACKATGKKLFAGVFSLSGLDSQISAIVSGVKGDWSAIHTVSVGNELVDMGAASAGDVMGAVSAARGLLRAAGYNGPVVTVDTLAATTRPGNSILCDLSDYCAVNAHPFFDSSTSAASAGQWLTDNIAVLKSKLANPSQQIVITETGWPSGGSANGAAAPSKENQAAAISSIKSVFASNPSGVIFLSAFNRQWMTDQGAFGQEHWFGLLGDSPSG
jgi:exo-beta-1,3-glucanase (GH17 family)